MSQLGSRPKTQELLSVVTICFLPFTRSSIEMPLSLPFVPPIAAISISGSSAEESLSSTFADATSGV